MRWTGHVARMGEMRGAFRLVWGNLNEGGHLEGPGVDGRIILKWILEKWNRSMDWIDMAKDRDRWRALVNSVMNLRVPYNSGNFSSS